MPYTIDASFNDLERKVIAAAMNDIEDNSCVRWSPRVGNENPHVRCNKEEQGCFADVGAVVNGRLNLGVGCTVSNTKNAQQMRGGDSEKRKITTLLSKMTFHLETLGNFTLQ